MTVNVGHGLRNRRVEFFFAVGSQRIERRALRDVPRRDYSARTQGQNYRRRGRHEFPVEFPR